MIYLIILLIAGLIFLISGKVQYNKTLYLEGTKARIAGLIFLAPLGLILLAVILMIVLESAGKITDTNTFELIIGSFANSMALNGLMIGLAYINFYSVSRETKTRGGCLTYWIALWALITILISFNLHKQPNLAQWVIIMREVIAFFQLISFLGIWLWKKWGVFGYVTLTLIAPIAVFFRTGSVLGDIVSLIVSLSSILLLYLLVKPKWQFFE